MGEDICYVFGVNQRASSSTVSISCVQQYQPRAQGPMAKGTHFLLNQYMYMSKGKFSKPKYKKKKDYKSNNNLPIGDHFYIKKILYI